MKKFSLALAITAAFVSSSALSATPHRKLSQTQPGAHWLMNDYMDCKGTKKLAQSKALGDLTCEQRSALHYCSIFEEMPKDIQANVALELYCNFLAEEKAGDEKEEEKIMAVATKAGCLTGDEVREKLNEKYKGQDDKLDSMQNFTLNYLEAEENCYAPDASRPSANATPDEKPVANAEADADKAVADADIQEKADAAPSAGKPSKKHKKKKRAQATEPVEPVEPALENAEGEPITDQPN